MDNTKSMHQKKLVPGRLIQKTSVIGRVYKTNEDKVLQAIVESDGLVGIYGNYDSVVSTYPTTDGDYRGFWTFCDEEDRREVYELLNRKGKTKTVDFASGRCFVPYEHEQERREIIRRRSTGYSYIFGDVEYGSIQNARELFKDVINVKRFLAQVDEELASVYKGRGHIYSIPSSKSRERVERLFSFHFRNFPKIISFGKKLTEIEKARLATGYYRPLEGSDPTAGKQGRVQEVKYRKFIIPMDHNFDASGGRNKSQLEIDMKNIVEKKFIDIIRQASDYEVPVTGVFDVPRIQEVLDDVPKEFVARMER